MPIPWPPQPPAKRRELGPKLEACALFSPPAPRPSPPRVVLDHRSFPHILSAILDCGDTRSLLALRGASRAYRDEVDARLFRHAVVGSDMKTTDQGLYVTVPGARGRRPKPSLRWRAGEAPPAQIASARILSIVNIESWESNMFSDGGPDLVSSLLARAPGVCTVRLSNSQMHLRYCRALASPSVERVVCIGTIAREAPCSPSHCASGIWVEAPTLPIGVRRFTLTIPYKPCFAYRQDLVGLFGSLVPSLREVTIVLANVNAPIFRQSAGRQRRSARLTPPATVAARRPNFSFIRTIVGHIEKAERKIRWTIVGVTAFLDEMDCTPTPSLEELESYIDTRLDADWRDRVSFLEPADYARRVGAEQYELETRHPEDEKRGRCSAQLSW